MARHRQRKTITVEVTKDDIALGMPAVPTRCPVALAMDRAVPVTGGWHITRAVVSRSSERYVVGVARMVALGVEVRLTRSVGEFTVRFDRGLAVEPFAFRYVK